MPQDFILQKLKGMQGVKVLDPEGAFYVLPDCSMLCGPHAHAPGFGDISDDDALCRQVVSACVIGYLSMFSLQAYLSGKFSGNSQ